MLCLVSMTNGLTTVHDVFVGNDLVFRFPWFESHLSLINMDGAESWFSNTVQYYSSIRDGNAIITLRNLKPKDSGYYIFYDSTGYTYSFKLIVTIAYCTSELESDLAYTLHKLTCIRSPNIANMSWYLNGRPLSHTSFGNRLRIIRLTDGRDVSGNIIHKLIVSNRESTDSIYSFQMKSTFRDAEYFTDDMVVNSQNIPYDRLNGLVFTVGNCTSKLHSDIGNGVFQISCKTDPSLKYNWIMNNLPLVDESDKYKVIHMDKTYDESGFKTYNILFIIHKLDGASYSISMETFYRCARFVTRSASIIASKPASNDLILKCVIPQHEWTELTTKCVHKTDNTTKIDRELKLFNVLNSTDEYKCERSSFTGVQIHMNPNSVLYNFTTGNFNVRVLQVFENMRKGIHGLRRQLC